MMKSVYLEIFFLYISLTILNVQSIIFKDMWLKGKHEYVVDLGIILYPSPQKLICSFEQVVVGQLLKFTLT